jgi:thymidylate synthase ThyX
MSYSAKILLDSVGPNEARLTTFELTYPRMVHAELMTHRLFSRNSASSRAIPTEKLLARIETDPALPVWWGKNQSGMQAKEEVGEPAREYAQDRWLLARDEAVRSARLLAETGLHKQIANRVVEPWMFITVIVSATEYDNWNALRVDPDAQPELCHVATMAQELHKNSGPRQLASGEWHLPLVTGNDEDQLRVDGFTDRDLCFISVGRCARVSYLTHDGVRDPKADIELAGERLLKSGHMSPFEHVAQALTEAGWYRYSNELAAAWIKDRIPVGNFWGWRQFRKTLANEHNFALIKKVRQGESR